MPDKGKEKQKEILKRMFTAFSKLNTRNQEKVIYFVEGMAAVREDERAELEAIPQ